MDGKTIAVTWATDVQANAYLSLRQQTRLADAIDAALAEKDAEIARLTERLPCGHIKHCNDDSYGGCVTCLFHKGEIEAEEEIAALRADLAEARKNIGPSAYGMNDDGSYNICLGYHPEEDEYEWVRVVKEEQVDALRAERDDMMRLYRIEHEKHTATLEQVEALRADLRACMEALRNAKTILNNPQSINLTRYGVTDMLDRALARPDVVGLDRE